MQFDSIIAVLYEKSSAFSTFFTKKFINPLWTNHEKTGMIDAIMKLGVEHP